MKTQIILLLGFTFIFGLAKAQESPYLSKRFAASEIKRLDVKTSDGGIFVKGSSGADCTVDVFVIGKDMAGRKISESEIEQRLKNYTITVKNEGGTLVCEAKTEKNINWKESLQIIFKILAPENVDANLKTSDGGLSLRNLQGNLNFSTSDGDIKLAWLSGKIHGSSSDGNITIRDSEGTIVLSTSDGNINAEGIEGTLEVKTSDGDIHIAETRADVSSRTSDGNIHIDKLKGKLAATTFDGNIQLNEIAGSIEAKTSDGNIHGSLSALGNYLRMSTGDGNIELGMPLDKGLNLDLHGDPVSMPNRNNFSGKHEKRFIQGKLNGGGIEVKLYASDGRVSIN